MANGFNFISPGIKFNETDLTLTTTSVGVTNAGLVGETLKGAAFEVVKVTSQEDFIKKFGLQSAEELGGSLKYLLPYYANEYLTTSSQLYVTRVLGLSGYDAGSGWAITVQGGIDTTSKTTSNTETITGQTIIVSGDTSYFSGTTFGFYEIPAGSELGVLLDDETDITWNGTNYSNIEYNYILSSTNVDFTATTYNYTTLSEYDNMVVAVIRSRADYDSLALNTKTFRATTLTLSGESATNVLGSFTLSATNVNGTELYDVSLDPNSQNFISRVLGDKPKGKKTKLYVETIYPDLIKKLANDAYAYKVNTTLVGLTTPNFTNYNQKYQTPETPYIVSELRGSNVDRLFKFISISDGNSANSEIKISIQNIDPVYNEFDVIIRDFNDTDANKVVLETFARCTMTESANNFVGKRIGTKDGKYQLNSGYVMLELAPNFPQDTVPAGFEGYDFRSFDSGATGSISATAPKIFYKTNYTLNDKVTRTYLGLSEKGYDSVAESGTGINQNMFNYIGIKSSNITKSKGFHLDSGAIGNYNGFAFEVGISPFDRVSLGNPTNSYFQKNTRKFTLVPAGGFDGWDEHRELRTNRDIYKIGNLYGTSTSDYYAYLDAINAFADPENVYINLLSTPGLNWSDNLALVSEAIDMIENERADCLYIVDSPDLHRDDPTYTVEDVVDLFDTTGIDSSYVTTYYPYVQIKDNQNGLNVYVPPTGVALRAMAFTDNVSFSWSAPAGVNRGSVNAIQPRIRLSESKRDVLYAGRINPIKTDDNANMFLWGQKTTQIKQTALDRVNVRRLVLALRKQISIISTTLLFEQNDDIVRDQFLQKVNPLLANVRTNRGISDYKVILDSPATSPEAIDRKEMYGKIYIKPISALEFIGIDFILTPQGANFQNI